MDARSLGIKGLDYPLLMIADAGLKRETEYRLRAGGGLIPELDIRHREVRFDIDRALAEGFEYVTVYRGQFDHERPTYHAIAWKGNEAFAISSNLGYACQMDGMSLDPRIIDLAAFHSTEEALAREDRGLRLLMLMIPLVLIFLLVKGWHQVITQKLPMGADVIATTSLFTVVAGAVIAFVIWGIPATNRRMHNRIMKAIHQISMRRKSSRNVTVTGEAELEFVPPASG